MSSRQFSTECLSRVAGGLRFSMAPGPGDSGFSQWLNAMQMVARLPGGIPPEFRRTVS